MTSPSHKATLREQSFRNWVRASIGLKYTKEGLECFIDSEALEFHKSLIKKLKHSTNLTQDLRTEIVSAHRFGSPSWKNSEQSKWSVNHWEVAKNYLPNTGGYNDTQSAAATDCSGLLNIGINLSDIAVRNNIPLDFHGTPPKFVPIAFAECRTARNEILHCARQSLTDAELSDYLNKMKTALKCTAALQKDAEAQQAVTKLEQLDTSVFEITDEDITDSMQRAELAIKTEGIRQVKAVQDEGERQRQLTRSDAAYHEKINRMTRAKYFQDIKRRLIETYVVQLEPSTSQDRLYEEPIMEVVTEGKRNKAVDISDVFFQGQTKYSRIYISGDAGCGKTSLCKMLVLAWCQVHSGRVLKINIPDEFLTVMVNFDLLFYITLRNIREDWVIIKMIENQYFEVQNFLNEYTKDESNKSSCLVILDGLDEWLLPNSYVTPMHTTHGLPDFRHVERFTILITTRPWKLEVMRLGQREMNRQIRLKGISKEASYRYIKNMTNLLNQDKCVRKNSDDFQQQLVDKDLEHFQNIPILLKQLITLWHHDENEITVSSQVHLYSAMINHLLRDAWERNERKPLLRKNNQEPVLPKCIRERQYCRIHTDLLLSLAHLAFTSTFKGHLIFDHVEAELQNLTENVIQYCLRAGVLCQEIYASRQDDEKKILSFLHKSFQDFLAAIFLVMNSESAQLPQTCNSMENILDMRSLFIFICGMDSRLMKPFSKQIQNIMKSDQKVKLYYSELHLHKLKPIQDMMRECVRESKANGQSLPYFHLRCVVIQYGWRDTDWTNLQNLIRDNKDYIRYIQIGDIGESPPDDLLACLGFLLECRSVKHASLCMTKKLPFNMERLLYRKLCKRWSLSSLKLELSDPWPYCEILHSKRVSTLVQLDICDMYILSHDGFEKVMLGVGKATLLRKLRLHNIECIQCRRTEDKYLHHLDMTRWSQLRSLTLESSRVTMVIINTTSLKYCKVSFTPIYFLENQLCLSTAINELDLEKITETQSLDEIVTILPFLTCLSTLTLRALDFGDRTVCLSPDATRLERVMLEEVLMTDRAMIKFLDSVLAISHKIDCQIAGRPNEDVETYIGTKFVVADRDNDWRDNVLYFYSNPRAH